MVERKYWKCVFSLIITYIALVSLGLILLYGVHRIPFEMIKANVEKSAHIIHHEGYYDLLGEEFHIPINMYNVYNLDGWTDALMLMEACNTGQENTFENALYNGIIVDGENFPFEYVQNYTKMEGKKNTYGRYWHGYLVTLIPALVFMDLTHIRIVNFVLFSLLLIVIAFLSYKKLGKGVTNIFLFVILISFFFPIVPSSLQFSTVFYIAYASTIVLLAFENLWRRRTHVMTFFFVIGGVTSFGDLLTAPLLTLGIPLIFYVLLIEKEINLKGLYKEIIIISSMWLLGYGLMWSTKWILVYTITGYDMIKNAMDQSMTRLGNDIEIVRMLGKIVFRTPDIIRDILLASFGFWLGCVKSKVEVKKDLWLLVIALIPVIWMCVLRNHSLLHYSFVWRSEIVSVYAILLFVYRTTDKSHITGFLSSFYKSKKQ